MVLLLLETASIHRKLETKEVSVTVVMVSTALMVWVVSSCGNCSELENLEQRDDVESEVLTETRWNTNRGEIVDVFCDRVRRKICSGS